MSGSERHYQYAPAPALHFRCTDDSLFRIIAAFDNHVGLEMPHKIERSVLGENYDEIHALERGEHVRALGVAADRPGGTLEAAHRLIAIDADDERVGAVACGSENVDVPGMEQIEDAVSECDPTLSSSSPMPGLGPCRNLCRGVSRLQGVLTTDG
jgi:hypothetical protein